MIMEGWKLTPHAIGRALDMGVKGEEIRQCLLNPDKVAKSLKYPSLNYRRGRITCATQNHRVVTIVWSSPELWEEDLKERPEYDGRSYRG